MTVEETPMHERHVTTRQVSRYKSYEVDDHTIFTLQNQEILDAKLDWIMANQAILDEKLDWIMESLRNSYDWSRGAIKEILDMDSRECQRQSERHAEILSRLPPALPKDTKFGAAPKKVTDRSRARELAEKEKEPPAV